MTVGQYLKKCRQKKDITYLELSKRLGIKCPQSIHNVESCKAKPPKKRVAKWCKEVGADKEYVWTLWVHEFGKNLSKNLKLKDSR